MTTEEPLRLASRFRKQKNRARAYSSISSWEHQLIHHRSGNHSIHFAKHAHVPAPLLFGSEIFRRGVELGPVGPSLKQVFGKQTTGFGLSVKKICPNVPFWSMVESAWLIDMATYTMR